MSDDKTQKTKKLIDLTMQLLEMSEDHEKRLIALEKNTEPRITITPSEIVRAEPTLPPPAKAGKKGFNNPFKPKDGKPWYTSAGSWLAIGAFTILCYMIYLFLKSQHFVIPKFHF